MNESVTTSSKKLADKSMDSQSFPMFKRRSSDLRNVQDTSCRRLALGSPVDCKVGTGSNTTALRASTGDEPSVLAASPPTEISSPNRYFRTEGISRSPGEQVNASKFLEGCNLDVERLSQENLTGSTPHIVPYRFNRRRTPVSSFRSGPGVNQVSSIAASKEHFSKANVTFLEHEHCKYQSNSAFLICEKTVDFQSNSVDCGHSFSFLRQKNASLSLHDDDPSTSNNNSPVLIGDQFQNIKNCSGIGFFPSRSSPPEVMNSENLYHGRLSLQKLPHSVNDKNSMRIYSSVNSVDGLPAGLPKFSHTARSLLITKTDVNMYKENQTFRESRVSTKFRGNASSDFLSLSPLSAQGQGGVKLQYLGSSSISDVKDNPEGVKTSEILLRNESSTDTDTMDMDMDAFKENHPSGVNSSSSNKDINEGQNQKSQAIRATTSEEVGCRMGLPDMNEELPAPPAAATSVDNLETSTSRTQSLDVEHILSHAEQLSSSEIRPCVDGSMRLEPSSRWIKRLKLSVPHSFATGTKTSNLGEGSSHEKVNNLFSKIMKDSVPSPEPTLGRRPGKEVVAPNPSFMDSEKRNQREILLSHSWIQRWCHNQAATREKKPEVVVVCEPQSSKLELGDVQKKQLPSIAAMALMGKAMSGFQPCKFQNRGSCVVWNTGSC